MPHAGPALKLERIRNRRATGRAAVAGVHDDLADLAAESSEFRGRLSQRIRPRRPLCPGSGIPCNNPKMRPSRHLVFGLFIALELGGCAGPRTEVIAKVSPAADFRAFKTYAFVTVDRLDMTGSQMADPVTRRNLEAAIGRELQAKGLSPAPIDTKPSLLVSYFADVYQEADKNRPISGSTGGANVQRQGYLAITIADPARDQVAWQGEAWARDPNAKIAEQVVVELMRKFPQAN